MEGVESGDAVDGDPVRVMLSLSTRLSRGPGDGTAQIRQKLERRSDHSVLWSGVPSPSEDAVITAPRRHHKTFWFDRVSTTAVAADTSLTNAARRLRIMERVAELRPYALGVLSGTNTSLLCFEGIRPGHERHGFLSTEAAGSGRAPSPCVASELFDIIVSECRKRGWMAYLSCAAIPNRHADVNETNGARHVVDLCGLGSPSSGLSLSPLDPILDDGTLFPAMHSVNVMHGRSPCEVLHQCMHIAATLKDEVQIPTHATLFATVSVNIPMKLAPGMGSAIRVCRLTLIDVALASHLSALCDLESHVSLTGSGLTPFLQRPSQSGIEPPPVLPLVFFGIALQNRCVVTATVTDASPLDWINTQNRRSGVGDALMDDQCPFTQLSRLSRLRRIVTAAESFFDHMPLAAVPSHAVPAWKLLCESMRLRRLANSRHMSPVADETTSIPPADSSEQSSDAAQLLKENAFLFPAGEVTRRLMADRLQAIKEVERDSQQHFQDWSERLRWLMSVPVVQSGGVVALDVNQRMHMLERSVAILEDENVRQRRVFQRDMNLVLLESSSANGARHRQTENDDDTTDAVEKCVEFGHSQFVRELSSALLCCSIVTDRDVPQPNNMEQSEIVNRIIDDYVTTLRDDLAFLIQHAPPPMVSGGKKARGHEADAPAVVLPFGVGAKWRRVSTRRRVDATFQEVLRNLVHGTAPDGEIRLDPTASTPSSVTWRGLTIAPDPQAAASRPPLEVYWENMLLERGAAQLERARLRHAAEALAAHTRRTSQLVQGLCDELNAVLTEGTSTISACNSAVTIGRGSRGPSKLLRQIEDLIQDEARNNASIATKLPSQRFSPIIHRLQLTAMKLKHVVDGLHWMALGYDEPPEDPRPGARRATSLFNVVQNSRGAAVSPPPTVNPLHIDASETPTTNLFATPAPQSPNAYAVTGAVETIPSVTISLDSVMKGLAHSRRVEDRPLARSPAVSTPTVASARRGYFSSLRQPSPATSRAKYGARGDLATSSSSLHSPETATAGIRTPSRRL